MRVIIFGATGRTGHLIAERAATQGHAVTAFVRDAKKAIRVHETFNLVVGDVRKAQVVAQAIEGHDAVICALGPEGAGSSAKLLVTAAQHIIAGMQKHGVKRLIHVSMAGIHREVPGLRGWWRQQQLAAAIADHRAAAEAIRKTQLRWTLVRPVTLDESPGRYAVRVATEGVPKGGRQISRLNLARFIADALDQELYIRQEPCVVF